MTMNGEIQEGLSMGQPIARREFLKKAAALGGSALALSQLRLSANAEQKAAEQKAKDVAKPAAAPTKPISVDHPQRGYNATETIQAKTFPNLATVEGLSLIHI